MNKYSFIENVRADTFRQYGTTSSLKTIKGFLTKRHFRSIITLRICQSNFKSKTLLNQFFFPFSRFIHKLSINASAMDLPWETEIQPGLAITHGWGLVIAPGCKIGKNVTIFHGVTLGRRDRITKDGNEILGYPIIEDDVWIGPNAIIVGNVTVGKGSRIAGGSFVSTDIPEYSLVMGNPSNIIKTKCIPDVPNPIKQIGN